MYPYNWPPRIGGFPMGNYYCSLDGFEALYRMPPFYNEKELEEGWLRQKAVKKSFTTEEARAIACLLKVAFDKFDVEQFRMGLDVELEHGRVNPDTNVTDDDPIKTGKIALAHLREFPDYYTRLSKMEREAKKYWGQE